MGLQLTGASHPLGDHLLAPTAVDARREASNSAFGEPSTAAKFSVSRFSVVIPGEPDA
jgi:hypothetical protein